MIRRRQAPKGVVCRSREGAWIEISKALQDAQKTFVAPARERGLKCSTYAQSLDSWRRSREGAWIEMPFNFLVT